MADDTAAVQALLDAVPSTGARVYLPGQTYNVGDLLMSARTYLYGDGEATVLQALPGARWVLKNRNAQARRTRLVDLRISGNKTGGGTGKGIIFDHTGIGGAAFQYLERVRIEECADTGLELINARSIVSHFLHLENNDGHGYHADGTSYDGEHDHLILGNSGLHNLWTSAGGYFTWVHSYFSGRLDSTQASVYVDNWATYGRLAGKIEDSPSHGLQFNCLGVNTNPAWTGWNVDIAFQNIGGSVLQIDHAHKCVIRAAAAGCDRQHATAILTLLTGLQNAGCIWYDDAIVTPHAPVQGDLAGNTLQVRAL